jgi:hypothetical protein
MPSAGSLASPSNCCTSSTWSSIPPAIATPRYTQFCEFYRRWLKRRGLSMRQVHLGGEKCFVDYAGRKPSIIDAATGEVIEVELFVAVLGASNYTYAEATCTLLADMRNRRILDRPPAVTWGGALP